MPSIFVNYRLREQAGYAALLDRALSDHFGADTVFRDFRSIRPGDDFAHRILDSLRSAAVLLAVIGPRWATSHQPRASRSDHDWVRREIAEAFTYGVRVVPVLVDGAALPSETDLPPDIVGLSRCQALQIRQTSIESDIEHLLRQVSRLIPNRHQLPDTTIKTVAP